MRRSVFYFLFFFNVCLFSSAFFFVIQRKINGFQSPVYEQMTIPTANDKWCWCGGCCCCFFYSHSFLLMRWKHHKRINFPFILSFRYHSVVRWARSAHPSFNQRVPKIFDRIKISRLNKKKCLFISAFSCKCMWWCALLHSRKIAKKS